MELRIRCCRATVKQLTATSAIDFARAIAHTVPTRPKECDRTRAAALRWESMLW